ncbi:tol-pal system protein YbgF [Sulfitobacter sp. JB4-11]|uniref:tol-pal system protein YbgF n=1 Tax=Sulfitobacter rhodophyticola TaxID=3238304 RepID=UPI003513D978
MHVIAAAIVALSLSWSTAQAQDDQTLADIRQELNILFVEVQKLRRELSTTGGANVNTAGTTVLERMTAMESELQRLTAKTEEIENRVNRVVADGTNRIGDLEFRLVELEGGDVAALGETTTLGGATETPVVAAPVEATPQTTTGGVDTSSLAVSEAADFERAKEVLATGDFRTAADLFATFNQTYPGGPLAPEAELRRGEALNGLGDTREAARAFLASFSASPDGPLAPQALTELGIALGALGQTQEACVTLSEVAIRFPQSAEVSRAQDQQRALQCSD